MTQIPKSQIQNPQNLISQIISRYEKGEIEEVNISVTTYYGVVFHDGTVGTITKAYIVYYDDDKKEIKLNINENNTKIVDELIDNLEEVGNKKAVELLRQYVREKYGIEIDDNDIEYDDDGNPFVELNDKLIFAVYTEYDSIQICGRESIYYTYYQPSISVVEDP